MQVSPFTEHLNGLINALLIQPFEPEVLAYQAILKSLYLTTTPRDPQTTDQTRTSYELHTTQGLVKKRHLWVKADGSLVGNWHFSNHQRGLRFTRTSETDLSGLWTTKLFEDQKLGFCSFVRPSCSFVRPSYEINGADFRTTTRQIEIESLKRICLFRQKEQKHCAFLLLV